jgi:hypothetical protein
MTQHYTRNTLSVAAWCPKCRKETQHRVDDRRRGPCLECLEKPLPATPPKPAPERGLFDEETDEARMARLTNEARIALEAKR